MSVLTGVILFPILLPWLPTRDFSSKGFIVGALTAFPFALSALLDGTFTVPWKQIAWAIAYMLCMPPVTAYLALNFTGSTTFTSRSGVKQEMRTYVLMIAGILGMGIVLAIVLSLV